MAEEFLSITSKLNHEAFLAMLARNQDGVLAVKAKFTEMGKQPRLTADQIERLNMMQEITDIYFRLAPNPGPIIDEL